MFISGYSSIDYMSEERDEMNRNKTLLQNFCKELASTQKSTSSHTVLNQQADKNHISNFTPMNFEGEFSNQNRDNDLSLDETNEFILYKELQEIEESFYNDMNPEDHFDDNLYEGESQFPFDENYSSSTGELKNLEGSSSDNQADDPVNKPPGYKQRRATRKRAAFYTKLSEEERQLRGRELMNARSREYRRRQKMKIDFYEKIHSEEEKKNKDLSQKLKQFEKQQNLLKLAITKLNDIQINENMPLI